MASTTSQSISRHGRVAAPNDFAAELRDRQPSLADRLFRPVLFMQPERIEPSAWLGHVPFAFWIMEAAQPSCLVELGTHQGVSYSAFLQAAVRLYLPVRAFAVDTWQGDPHSGFYNEEVFNDLRAYHDASYGAFSTLLRMSFDEAAQYFGEGSIDLLHIDGYHTYEAVSHDVATWLPKLSRRGVLLLHDINVRERAFGAWRVWAELCERYPSFEFVHSHGLGMLAVGPEASEPVRWLAHQSSDREATRQIRDLFAALGQNAIEQRRRREAEDLVDASRRQAEQLESQLARTEKQKAEAEAALAEAERSASAARATWEAESAAAAKATERAQAAWEAEIAALAETAERAKADTAAAALRLQDMAHELETARQEVAEARAQAALARAEASSAQAALAPVLLRAERAEAASRRHSDALALIHSSPYWRAAAAARALGDRVPAGVRRTIYLGVRGGLRLGRPILWLLSAGPRARHELSALRSSPLFDPAFYLARYPDVAAARIDPVVHYMRFGAAEGRDPGPAFSTLGYQARNPDVAAAGLNPLLHYIRHGQAEGRTWAAPAESKPADVTARTGSSVVEPAPCGAMTAFALAARRWADLRPLRSYPIPSGAPRLSIVTDSVGPSSMFGGVGTSMILGALAANEMGANLRLITRTEPADASVLHEVLSANGIVLNGSFEVAFAPLFGGDDISIAESDLFLTTSWWTTRATLSTVERRRVMYLLQEDERMFYGFGDERLRAAETMAEPDLLKVINTEILFRHLAASRAALPNIAETGIWFEPAFPYSRRERQPADPGRPRRRKFAFYARPNNLRNLFWRGLEAVSAAIEGRILDPRVWEIHFVGRDIPDLVLPCGVRPVRSMGLSWSDYHALMSSMDAGMILMDTVHPSYPPLDLAAAGAAVLTTIHPGKESLECYSKNILLAEPTLRGLTEGLRRVAALGLDDEARAANRRNDRIARDWTAALRPAVEHIRRHFSGQLRLGA